VNGESLKAIHVLSLGFCALCAQSIFIRELMALFTGTELVIGILLAGWLLSVGFGGLVGGRVVKGVGRGELFRFTIMAFIVSLLLPATAVGIRFGRGWIVSVPGVLPPFAPAILLSFAAMAPFGFLYGTLYNSASRLWKREGGIQSGVTRVYIWEAAGSLAGAVAFSFILLTLFSQLEASFVIAFVVIGLFAVASGDGRPIALRSACLLAIGIAFLIIAPRLDRVSIEAVYPGYRVERFLSSRYGEIVAASREEVVSYFSGGGRLFSVPEPERAEEVVHLPLLLHPEPKRLLLIGGSLGGGWEEAIKHPSIESIDCLELDGELLRLALETTVTDSSMQSRIGSTWSIDVGSGRTVRFIEGDGRFFLSTRRQRYDVIILNAPPPINLQWNRYYTREFFELARASLNPGGLFGFGHPSSENFISDEQAVVLRSLEITIESVFGEVTILPGSTVHFIAGDTPTDPEMIVPRLEAGGVETRYISRDFLPYRFSKERIDFLRAALDRADGAARNTDMRPVLPMQELVLEGRRSGSRLMTVFTALISSSPLIVVGVLVTAIVVLFIAARAGAAARLSVWAVGFGSFLLQLLVLLIYQSFTGILYHAIVMMTALFMAGASVGAYVSNRRGWTAGRALRLMHLLFIVLALSLIAWTFVLGGGGVPQGAAHAVFLFCAFCGGGLTGMYYPVVVRTALPDNGRAVPATFYAWDLFGACVGGFVGGAVLFPALGVHGTALFVVFVHLAASVLVVGRW
jgi:spermidine synthase